MAQDTLEQTVVLEQAVVEPITVLFISDSSDMAALKQVIQRGYSELFSFISKNELIPGKVMCFYFTYTNPISLQTAVEVNRVPAELSGRIKHKTTPGGKAVIAHYKGPYEEMEVAYNAISKWLQDNNKKARDYPFEVYLNDPATVKSQELKTDVYQLLE